MATILTCEAIEKSVKWPYVKECPHPAMYKTDHNYEGKFNQMFLCNGHANNFRESFPKRALEKL